MLERWIAFKQRLATVIWPNQLEAKIGPLELQQGVYELIDLILFSRFGIDEQTFKVVLKVDGTDNALASNEGLIFDFAGLVRVERNGRSMDVWRGEGPVTDFDCYFTVGNSTRARANGQTKKGDRLRWNASKANALLPDDLLKVSAMVALASGGDTTPSGIDIATSEDMLAVLANGPYPKSIAYDSGTGLVILYFYSPRAGLKEVWTFDPTTERT